MISAAAVLLSPSGTVHRDIVPALTLGLLAWIVAGYSGLHASGFPCQTSAMDDDVFAADGNGLGLELDGDAGLGDIAQLQTAQAKAKGKAKAKAKGKAKAKAGAGGAGGRRMPVTSCICPRCTFPKYPGSRFCSLGHHKKAWDNMVYQRRSRKEISEEQKKAFDEAMADDGHAGREVEAFALDNPPEMRKKGLVDFTRFERIVGLRVSRDDQDGTRPMTERAFLKYCENTLGLEDEEAAEYWQTLYGDRSIERDNGGFKGAEQLWVPAHKMRLNTRSRYVDNRVVEGSDSMKAPSAEQREMLRKHLERQCPDLADEHFQTDMPVVTPTKKSGQPSLDDPTPEKPNAKVVNLSREKALLQRSMESCLKKVSTELRKASELSAVVREGFDNHPPELRSGDRGLLLFSRIYQFRQETGMRVLDTPAEIIQLVPDAVMATGEGPAPGTPASELQGAEIAKGDQLSEKKQLDFKAWLALPRVQKSKFWEGPVDALMTLEQGHILRESVVACADDAEFLTLKNEWSNAEKALMAVPKAMKQSGDDLLKHLKLKIQEDIRDKKRHGLSCS